MNTATELLEKSKWGDGLKPEHSQDAMGELVKEMRYEDFKDFCKVLEVIAPMYELLLKNGKRA